MTSVFRPDERAHRFNGGGKPGTLTAKTASAAGCACCRVTKRKVQRAVAGEALCRITGCTLCIRSKEYTLRAKCLRHALAEHDAQRTCADDFCDDRLFFIIHFLRKLLVLCKIRSDACRGAGTAATLSKTAETNGISGWEDSVCFIIACRRKGVQQNRRNRGFAVCSKGYRNFNMIFIWYFVRGPCYNVLGFILRCLRCLQAGTAERIP